MANLRKLTSLACDEVAILVSDIATADIPHHVKARLLQQAHTAYLLVEEADKVEAEYEYKKKRGKDAVLNQHHRRREAEWREVCKALEQLADSNQIVAGVPSPDQAA
jgi:hypothetical protein